MKEKLQNMMREMVGLDVAEAVSVYGKLGQMLGASIAGFKSLGDVPSVDELQKEYYSNPTVDVALMIQGVLISSWEADFKNKPQLSKYYMENKEVMEEKE